MLVPSSRPFLFQFALIYFVTMVKKFKEYYLQCTRVKKLLDSGDSSYYQLSVTIFVIESW